MKRTFMLRSAAAGCILLLHAAASSAQYCVPAYSACNTFSNNINTFFVTGENGTGLEVISSGNAVNCYEYNTINTVIMQQGQSYQADMNSEDPGNNYVQIFVDFNDDFTFDPTTETVGGSNSVPGQPGTTSFPINIPAGAQIGVHRMRVVLNMVDQLPNIDPCPGANYPAGETNDFLVDVVGSGTICSPISNLIPSGITQTAATLTWTGATGIGYEYVLDQVASNPSGAGTAIGVTTYSASSLTPGTAYYMHVRNNCGGGDFSNWTTTSFMTTGTPACAPVTGLVVTNILATTATIQWTAVVGSVDYQYTINQVATAPAGPGTTIQAATYNASALTPNTNYYVHVRNNCGVNGFSTWATQPFSTLPVGIDDVKNSAAVVNVFPNPTADIITVTAVKTPSGKAEIQVTDIAGKVVKQVSMSTESTTIGLQDLANGIYLLRYTDAGNTQIIKISKQ